MKPSFVFFIMLSSFGLLSIFQNEIKAQTLADSLYTNSLKIGVDIARIGQSIASQGKLRGAEFFVNYNQKKNIFNAEYGFATREEKFANFVENTSGSYIRLGYDRNILNKGADLFHLGGRLSFSSFNHKANSITLQNPPFPVVISDGLEAKSFVMWLEAIVGIKVIVYGPIGMGFNLRLQRMIYNNYSANNEPSSAPGYGNLTRAVSPAFNYYLFLDIPHKTYYHINTKKKTNN